MNKLILISLVIFFAICSKSWAEEESIYIPDEKEIIWVVVSFAYFGYDITHNHDGTSDRDKTQYKYGTLIDYSWWDMNRIFKLEIECMDYLKNLMKDVKEKTPHVKIRNASKRSYVIYNHRKNNAQYLTCRYIETAKLPK